MTRKDTLNGPDEFVSTASTVLAWVKEHPANAAVVAAVVLGILVSGLGLYYWKTTRERDAMNAFLKATDEYEMTLGVTKDFAGTRADRLAHLRLARMNYDKGDYARALSLAETFIDEWDSSDVFNSQALLIAAACHMREKRFDKAEALLDTCIASATGLLRDQALFLKGSLLLDQGKTPEARQVLQTVSDSYRDLARSALAARGGQVMSVAPRSQ